MIEVLSLGGGVQSSVVALMSVHGELPKLGHAVFADTGWEPKAVYDWLRYLVPILEDAGIRCYQVSMGNIKEDTLRYQVAYDGLAEDRHTEDGRTRWASMPLYVINPDGSKGMVRRQCTHEYKIRAIEMCIRREVMGLQPRQRAPSEKAVRQWFGISFDERRRMKTDAHKWVSNWYPLVEKKITRLACLDWCRRNGYPEPPRSACIGCPYRSNKEWRRLTAEEFQEACEFDDAIRNCGGMRGQVFLHSQRIPLREVNLTTDTERGQMLLSGFEDECSGMCGC